MKHIYCRLDHSKEGNQTGAQSQHSTNTETNSTMIVCLKIGYAFIESLLTSNLPPWNLTNASDTQLIRQTYKVMGLPLTMETGLCLHLSTCSICLSVEASTCLCIPEKFKMQNSSECRKALQKFILKVLDRNSFIAHVRQKLKIQKILTGLLRWLPTESANVPIASYNINRFLC